MLFNKRFFIKNRVLQKLFPSDCDSHPAGQRGYIGHHTVYDGEISHRQYTEAQASIEASLSESVRDISFSCPHLVFVNNGEIMELVSGMDTDDKEQRYDPEQPAG